MAKNILSTKEEIISHLIECTLATISGMAFKKSRVKSEYRRQISIAQSALDGCKRAGMTPDGSRTQTILSRGITVEAWAKEMEENQ